MSLLLIISSLGRVVVGLGLIMIGDLSGCLIGFRIVASTTTFRREHTIALALDKAVGISCYLYDSCHWFAAHH